jgi:hypothetical protein
VPTTPSAQPAPGTAPVAGDTAAPPAKDKSTPQSKKDPAPGTTPVAGDVPAADVNPDKVVEPGSKAVKVKPGSIEDVNAVGNRPMPMRSRRAHTSSPTRWLPNM